MKPHRYGAVSLALLGTLSAFSSTACAQSTPKTIIVNASSETSGRQQLELKGVKTPANAAGVRVFLDPGSETKLDPGSKSYVGSLYFSHQSQSDMKEGNFVLPLHRKVTGAAHVVIYPISSKGSAVAGSVEVQDARIRAADNSIFQ